MVEFDKRRTEWNSSRNGQIQVWNTFPTKIAKIHLCITYSVNNSQNNVNPSRPDYNQDDNPGGQGGYNPSRPVTSRPPYNPGGQGGFNPSRPVTSRPPYNRPTARPPYKPQTTQRSYISEDSWKTTERSYIAEDSWNNEGSGFDDDEGDSWDDDDPFGSDDEDDDDGWGNFGRK